MPNQLEPNSAEKRYSEFKRHINFLIKEYGMEWLLQALIDEVDKAEKSERKKGKGELAYLRLLSIDFEHTLKNYKRREEIERS